jgi:hypothetical protein
MESLEGIKRSLNKEKIKEVLENILMEDSILNYPVFDLGLNVKKIGKKMGQFFCGINWFLLFKKSQRRLTERTSLLTIFCASLFCWMFFSGVLAYNFPEDFSLYTQGAYGASEQDSGNVSALPALKIDENPILNDTTKPKENSISEAKCSDDAVKNRSSDLCGDIEKDQKLIADMNAEAIGMKNKELAKIAARRPKRAFSRGATCAEKNDHPGYSDTKGKHMDEDCCPDPDEWPKPGCAYSASGLSLMLKGAKK